MCSAVASPSKKKSDANGEVRLAPNEFRDFFNLQARKTVGVSGKEALRRIRRGKCGSSLAWTELTLLSALLLQK